MIVMHIFQTLHSILLTFLVAYNISAFYIIFLIKRLSLNPPASTSTIISILPLPQTFRLQHHLLNILVAPTVDLPSSTFATQASAGPGLELWKLALWHCRGTPPKATYIGFGSASALH